jgi:hypothetical protein
MSADRLAVGVPRETFPGEARVALVPAVLAQLAKAGMDVVVEVGGGAAAGFTDRSYADHGARLGTRDEVFAADVVAQVRACWANPDEGRLDPHRLEDRLPQPVVDGTGRPVGVGEHPPRPAGREAKAGVGGDAVQPVVERGPALVAAQPTPGREQRLLQGVVGVVHRAEHPVTVRVQRRPVLGDQPVERLVIALPGGVEISQPHSRPSWPSSILSRSITGRRYPLRHSRQTIRSKRPTRHGRGCRRTPSHDPR